MTHHSPSPSPLCVRRWCYSTTLLPCTFYLHLRFKSTIKDIPILCFQSPLGFLAGLFDIIFRISTTVLKKYIQSKYWTVTRSLITVTLTCLPQSLTLIWLPGLKKPSFLIRPMLHMSKFGMRFGMCSAYYSCLSFSPYSWGRGGVATCFSLKIK